jgi:Na+-transporting NADH:ubiquinone oxidoreductase subunit NqrD
VRPVVILETIPGRLRSLAALAVLARFVVLVDQSDRE